MAMQHDKEPNVGMDTFNNTEAEPDDIEVPEYRESGIEEEDTSPPVPPTTQDAEWDEPKTLNITDAAEALEKIPDIQITGNKDTFKLLCKASSKNEGWMKSTKAMQTPHGCVVQVTTQQKNPDGSYAIAEALTYVPGAKLAKDGDTRKLVNL